MVERNPESQTATSFSLKNANILNPTDEASDFDDQTFDAEWYAAITDKQELEADRAWLHGQIGADAMHVARGLTKRWQFTDPPKIRRSSGEGPLRPNGRVLRVLRRQTKGLLLIYPVLPPTKVRRADRLAEPTGIEALGPPIFGVALSFPSSATTQGVEYRVNKVWSSEISEDGEYED
jgi:hypothetical protein